MFTDRQLIAAARSAGLCFPDCWGLDHLLNAEAQATDQEWIDAAYSEEDRSHRQDIRDRSLDSARERLLQLRRFAQIIAEASRAQ